MPRSIRLPAQVTLSLLLLATLSAGCRLLHRAANETVRVVTPGSLRQPVADPVEVQQTLVRFSDAYLARTVSCLDKLRYGTNAPAPAELLKWKIGFGTETCAIVSGPNAIANLLDLTIFITVTRKAVEDYWQPKVFGESAQPMLESCRQTETDAWQLTSKVLTAEQQAELRRAIDVWYQQNPLPESVVAARAVGFAAQVAAANKANKAETERPESVFSLLMLDPLAGMDPAVREITQARLFAERALYVTQKMPTLIRWQTDLLALNALEMPAVQQVVSNSTQITASVERFARVAEQLPGQLSLERAEILKALAAQEKEVAALMTRGTSMSDSLNTTLKTFDALMKRFGVGEPNTNPAAPPDPNAAPFRILDYAETAARLEVTARQLTELLVTLDRTLGSTNLAHLSAQVAPVVQQAQASGKEVVDYAFRRALLFVGAVLLAALLYRFISARRAFSKNNPS